MNIKRFALVICALLVLCLSAIAKVETWRQDSASAFAKGKKERVVVSDTGRVRLGRKVAPTSPLEATHVWDLAQTKAGVIYAATGSAGRVYRREGKDAWTVAHDADDSQALSVASLPDGRVFAGTGPTGKVIEVSDPKAQAVALDPSVKYVWDLVSDADGNLFAATGPTGQLWKRSPEGKWSVFFDSKYPHLLCLAVGNDGSVYAGSDGEGLIYKITKDGKPSVLYDAPQSEVRSLLLGPDGSLFAATAAEAAGSGGSGGPGTERGFSVSSNESNASGNTANRVLVAQNPAVRPGGAEPAANPVGGTAMPRPGPPGENAVYRIGADGAPREIFKTRALFYSLALSEDRLLVGTGPEGLIYEVRDLGGESSPIARLNHGQVLSLLATPSGEILIGAGDPGAVLTLDSGSVAEGSIVSEVHDTKLISRFGAVTVKVTRPEGTSVAVQVRSGNVGDPDATWSKWSSGEIPPGRFVQYRATLKTDRPTASPELSSVAILYQTANLPPEISKVVVPDLSAGDGAAKQAKLAVRWDVTDPNDDDLAYTLRIRKDGWPDWVTLTETPITEKTYSWDITAIPGGMYRLEVSASDRPSNPLKSSLSRTIQSEPFVIDHLAPVVGVAVEGHSAKIALKDDLTRLVKASYSLDGGEWVAVFPDDGLFDTSVESITIPMDGLKPGVHILTVRATDAAGNVGAGDAVFK